MTCTATRKHIVDISQSDTSCDVMVHGIMIKTKENLFEQRLKRKDCIYFFRDLVNIKWAFWSCNKSNLIVYRTQVNIYCEIILLYLELVEKKIILLL